ncbi:peptidylprolyl isomerase [Rhodanobacter thiooxydans]|uniref:Chaperone SurA n=1 Tax=Rhodanobacter thiooxydans TaxID=416169 RepID=A0A154QGT5_9GAMM|nr:peptidylprolyl isomerase [Rhodanobacter thiooxydans]EIM02451.1 parvulin-like peptidyl-prolyl isomerase [Rhodanobacter thiooxydans LCS2]KZC23510.1 peptidylprolyl isomerase [Rhodanobacter thiooxydans]MCW0201296.1 peptidylprolyl isomerase [Rhodanobacter thiooxydans]
MKQSLASLLLALAIMLPAHAQLLAPAAPADQPLDRIVAVVNDDVILQSELNDAVASVQQQYAGRAGQLPPMNVLQQQVLNRLVLMRLQIQKAQDQGIRISNADVDQAVQGVAEQNKLSPEQLRAEVERSGASFASFREQLADQITVQRLHQSVVQDSVSVTDSEIDNLLSSPTYKAGEVHLAHIQISIPGGADATAIQASQAKAEQALAAIKGGMDFNAAAIRYSDASDALDGGDLGWRRLDEIPPAFADTLASMKPGDVSAALRGPTGFHILKLVDQRQSSRKMVTELHARQILIKPSDLLTPAQAQQKAQDLYHRIVDKHEDFATLAKENSKDDTTANIGGDMGWFPPQAWGQAIAAQLAQLKDDQVSQPFQSAAGWHIVQRLGERQSDQTVQIERDQARQAIGTRKSEQVYDDYLRDLRSNAYVDVLVPELRDADSQAAASSP